MRGRSGTLSACPGCGRRIVFSPTVHCSRCVNEDIERRYQQARTYYRHTCTMTDEACWAGVGTSLSAAQDYAPVYAEVTGCDAKGEPK